MKKPTTIISAVLLYVVTTSISYATINYLNSGPSTPSPTSPTTTNTTDANSLLNIKPNEPKTEACPLNGQLYTKTEREAWEKRRPLAIMVENSAEARPQSGLIRSDVLYEAVAEGGVTRFMPVFYCDAQRSDVLVAPVRSVRTYFIDWASEYGQTPLFGHVLGANCSSEVKGGPCKSDPRAQAIEQLNKFGWRYSKGNDLDQAAIGAPTYRRNEARLFSLTGQNVVTEHSMEGRTELLWKVGLNRGWTNLDPDGVNWLDDFRSWKFKEDAKPENRGPVNSITHDFWEGYKQFDARWEYNPTTNTYLRFTGGEPHKDLETGQQLYAKNVAILITKETGPVDDLKHLLYTTIGESDAYIFQDGQVIKGSWKKDSRLARTLFYTKKGQEIAFNPGRLWISVVAKRTNVVYPTPTP